MALYQNLCKDTVPSTEIVERVLDIRTEGLAFNPGSTWDVL